MILDQGGLYFSESFHKMLKYDNDLINRLNFSEDEDKIICLYSYFKD